MKVITTYIRGHKVYYNNKLKKWLYFNNDESIKKERPCPRCNKMPTIEGYDHCLGYIKGATSACCGHGVHLPILMKENQ